MYQNPAHNVLVGRDGSDSNGVASNNPNNTQIMDPIQQQQQQQQQRPPQNINYNGMQPQQQMSMPHNNNPKNIRKRPYVRIIEQPASKALRFRYECEGRSAGSIPGVNSTSEHKTYPTIEIVGYKGRAVIVVSCVTKDEPYRPHPHNLVGKECKKAVCTVEINTETMRAVFSNLGIQCVKKKDIETALKAREEIRVDPFHTGFSHRLQPSSIDLNSVRLCFQAFLEKDGRFAQPLAPVVSDPIYDKKAMSDLVICRLCSCAASVLGNTQMMLFCEKVTKEDISIRFFEEKDGQTIWEAYGEFQHTDVHKQTGIAFKTPRYRKTDITEPAKVFIQLKRPSDGVTSEPLPFEYVPLESDPAYLKRKRQKTNGDPVHMLLQHQKNQRQNQNQVERSNISCWNDLNMSAIKTEPKGSNTSCWNAVNITAVKTEPKDSSNQPFNIYHAPSEPTPSPQPLSPSTLYTHHTPAPYNLTTAATSQANQQMNSSNLHYNTNNARQQTMNIGDYNAFSHQTQQQQQQHQQQYHENNFGGASTNQWKTKFDPTAATNNNLNSFNPANTYNNMHNSLITANASAPGTGTNGNGNAWNFNHHQNHLPQQYQQHETQNDRVATANNNAVIPSNAISDSIGNVNNDNKNDEHGLSNLLTFGSEQLVCINSEDQQMLRLSTEDLQLSNLSIST